MISNYFFLVLLAIAANERIPSAMNLEKTIIKNPTTGDTINPNKPEPVKEGVNILPEPPYP
jgi:hypothetical protein